MGSDSKKKKSGSKSDSSSRSRSKDKSDSSSKSKADRSKSKDGGKSDSSSKSKKEKKEKEVKEVKPEGAANGGAAPAMGGKPLSASQEFEAGMLFSKFDKDNLGLLDKTAFVEMYKEFGKGSAGVVDPQGPPPVPPSFQAGQMYARYANEGGMTMSDFERFVGDQTKSEQGRGGKHTSYTHNTNTLREPCSLMCMAHMCIAYLLPLCSRMCMAPLFTHVHAAGVTFSDQNMPPSFAAGQLYERFADKAAGKMSKVDFEKMMTSTNLFAGSKEALFGDVSR